MARAIQEDVLRFQIAVKHALQVQVLQRQQNLQQTIQCIAHCVNLLLSMAVICLDYSVSEDW